MVKITYELRYMLLLLQAVVNQKPVQLARSNVHWETILRTSDLQNILGIIYCAILGIEKEMSQECSRLFYEKYKRELLVNEAYKSAEEAIRWKLEQEQIRALFLFDSTVGDLYDNENMVHIEEIELLIERQEFYNVRRILIHMDYEEKQDRLGNGYIFVRQPGIRVIVYDRFPTDNKVINHFFDDPIKTYERIPGYQYMHRLLPEEKYIYYVNRMFHRYLNGILKVRDILDFRQLQKQVRQEFQWKTADALFAKAKLQEFFRAIAYLQTLWFGKSVGKQEETVFELESYILVPGSSKPDEALIPSQKVRMDFYREIGKLSGARRSGHGFFRRGTI